MTQLSQAKSTTHFKAIPYDAATEIESLYQELIVGRQALLQNQKELQRQVDIRTKELNQANDKLTELANTDTLTALYNRRYLDEHFSVMQSILSRNHSGLMYAIVDIDLFKGINDSYGHLFGDFCLAATAKILKEFFHRDADIVTRFGGEEFVIVAPYSDVNNARLRVESMRLQVANYSFKKGAIGPVELTVSVGIAIGDARYSNAQGDWFTIADKCLYQAKNNGRNQTNIKLLSSKK